VPAHGEDVATDLLVRRLRAAGCVFAEDEAAVLQEATTDPARLEAMLRRREAGEPLEQVVGWVGFGGLRLAVGPGVFVPRQRTLLLARAAVELARAQPAPVLVEAFAGVAPVAASVADAVPGAQVHACDVDPRALAHARRNLPPGAGVHEGPLLEGLPAALRGRVTLLVAVPPYVPRAAAALLPREALDHEPAAALFGGDDGLDLLRALLDRALLDRAGPWVVRGGAVLVELGAAQCPAAVRHAEAAGCSVRRREGEDGQTVVLEVRPGTRPTAAPR